MDTKFLICLLLFAALATAQTASNSSYKRPCVAFQSGGCIACPSNYHMYQNECYLNITGCQQYSANSSGFQICSVCDQSISVPDGNGGCTLTVSLQQLANLAYLQQVSANYGDLRFESINLGQALNNVYFRIVNSYMLNGDYKHFISRTSQPIQSVSTFNLGSQMQFKVLYAGSGGGLMLCLISINTLNNALTLSSFVPIGVTSVIDNCDQYSLTVKCLQCLPGYHLENSICYIDIENCISYSQNICLQCAGYSILVENRCLTCNELTDLAQINFYGDFRLLPSTPSFIYSRRYLVK